MLNNIEKKLIVIAGPTAIGKTDLAFQIAKQLNCAIISADSRQVFKETTIGTAKPSSAYLNEIPHYFINHVSIHQPYNAGLFGQEALNKINYLHQTNNYVIIVGGSGLYINAVLHGLDEFIEVPIQIRENLNATYKTHGLVYLQEQLKKLDPIYFKKIDIQNPQRMLRALEIITHTNKSYSSFLNKKQLQHPFKIQSYVLETDRENLYNRINVRVDCMINEGIVEEAQQLFQYKHCNALNTVGYKELFQYFDKNISIDQAILLIKQHTRQYAKRQITWFTHQNTFTKVLIDDAKKALELVVKQVNS